MENEEEGTEYNDNTLPAAPKITAGMFYFSRNTGEPVTGGGFRVTLTVF